MQTSLQFTSCIAKFDVLALKSKLTHLVSNRCLISRAFSSSHLFTTNVIASL
jgi:hypothetical protein